MLTECTEKIQQLQNKAIDMNKELLEINKLLDTIKKESTNNPPAHCPRQCTIHTRQSILFFIEEQSAFPDAP